MIGFTVIMGDPSELLGGDAFAWVGAQLKLDGNNTIEFKLAKQFWNGDLANVARYARRVYRLVKPNIMGLETNRRIDKQIHMTLRKKYKMPWLQSVIKSNNLTAKTRQMGYALDTNHQVHWLKDKMEAGEVSFPAVPSKDMEELIDQWPKIVEMPTLSGGTTYKAARGQHDDLFVAALHCSNVIRLFIEQQERLK